MKTATTATTVMMAATGLLMALLIGTACSSSKAETKPDEPEASGPTTSAGTPSRPEAKRPAGAGRVLLPPSEIGANRAAFDGCLTAETEDESKRFPVTRKMAPPPAISALNNGIVLSHELTHGCCLKARVDSSVEAGVVTIKEVLTGESCRCRCQSTIRAAVGLAPGDYTVKVLLDDQSGAIKTVTEQPVSVKAVAR